MSKEVKTPCCEDVVDALIANERTKYEAADKEWLMTLEENQLTKMIPEKEKEQKVIEVNKTVTAEQVVNAVKGMKPEEVAKLLSNEDQAALAYGRRQLKERRNLMFKGIQDNAGKENFPDDVLNAYDEDTLERVFNAVKKVDYTLNSSPEVITANAEEPLYPAGVKIEDETKK